MFHFTFWNVKEMLYAYYNRIYYVFYNIDCHCHVEQLKFYTYEHYIKNNCFRFYTCFIVLNTKCFIHCMMRGLVSGSVELCSILSLIIEWVKYLLSRKITCVILLSGNKGTTKFSEWGKCYFNDGISQCNQTCAHLWVYSNILELYYSAVIC